MWNPWLLRAASGNQKGKEEQPMRTWKRLVLIASASAVLLASGLFAGRVSAAEYPQVGNLTAFSAEANYMSLAGYLRYLDHAQDGAWLTRSEAVRIVKQQQAE